jgi:hypothetical protein
MMVGVRVADGHSIRAAYRLTDPSGALREGNRSFGSGAVVRIDADDARRLIGAGAAVAWEADDAAPEVLAFTVER